jgi:AcrR family transcriptional regulator
MPEETRGSILEAAVKVFERDGYQPTSIDAIADAAGVSRRTIYHHFKTKNDILVASTLEQAHLFLEALEREVAPSDDFPAFVVDCLCFVIREAPRSRFFMLQMARGVATESATIRLNHPCLIAEWLDYFREPYIEALQKRRINPAIDLGDLLNWFGRVATSFLQYPASGDRDKAARRKLDLFIGRRAALPTARTLEGDGDRSRTPGSGARRCASRGSPAPPRRRRLGRAPSGRRRARSSGGADRARGSWRSRRSPELGHHVEKRSEERPPPRAHV